MYTPRTVNSRKPVDQPETGPAKPRPNPVRTSAHTRDDKDNPVW